MVESASRKSSRLYIIYVQLHEVHRLQRPCASTTTTTSVLASIHLPFFSFPFVAQCHPPTHPTKSVSVPKPHILPVRQIIKPNPLSLPLLIHPLNSSTLLLPLQILRPIQEIQHPTNHHKQTVTNYNPRPKPRVMFSNSLRHDQLRSHDVSDSIENKHHAGCVALFTRARDVDHAG